MKRGKVLASSPTDLPLKFDHKDFLDRALYSENPVLVNGVQQNVPFFCNTTLTSVEVSLYNDETGTYNFSFDISWGPVQGASKYTVTLSTLNAGEIYTVEYPSETSAKLYLLWLGPEISPYKITIKADDICLTTGVSEINPCFLEGSVVQMADGTQKTIENVAVGDLLLGAFGEVNPVLALHRPLLGSASMTRINKEHSTTSHHPHISVDRGFYCSEPSVVETTTYGHEHDVIDGSGNVVKRMLHGLKKGRVQKLETGVILKTVDGGRPVFVLEQYTMPPETQLYNLVMGGSHTYHVDGYAVTGWPREDDWNYDSWTPI